MAPPASSETDRYYVDNSNASELKLTCDEAVERILTRETIVEADSDSKPTSTSSPSPSIFPPFKASHFHTDLRLVLGFTASAVMIGVCVWSYFVEKDWEKNKKPCGIAVVIYVVLSAIQTLDSYMQGSKIFEGKRKTVSKRIETERLSISSPSLPKAVIKPPAGGTLAKGEKPTLIPPAYTLKIDYTRKSNNGKSLLGKKKTSITLGHMGEWFTEEGEFIESIFEQRLISNLEKAFGQ
ncbi:hypothetical protein IE53DRAFT_389892 [Violaceomyces palustris]|uniref:Uncharacterized protein n=1 Tax=Violaceomyces palustris TaxID=1673888 RepID=A0ACD0NQ81_9BASI|nr:hypothetical protein IE53DRAFT_389892 [Violaceomyces palustris]